MLMIVSPAKTFNEMPREALQSATPWRFHRQTQALVEEINKYDQAYLAQWMKMSDALAVVNKQRFEALRAVDKKGYTAIEYLSGEAFKGLDAGTLGQAERIYLQQHLIILSGLYGCIHPNDVILPYRLEMQTKFEKEPFKELARYWRSTLTDYVIEQLEVQKGERILINLASNEYMKALDKKRIQQYYPVLTITFKEQIGEHYKAVAMYAKKARGQMARYIASNQVERVEVLKAFNEGGYLYNEALSNEMEWVFVRIQG